MKLKGDKTVNPYIESKLKRESNWKKKSSTIVENNSVLANIVATNQKRNTTSATTRHQDIKSVKIVVRKSIKEQIKDRWNNKVYKLTMQGDFTKHMIEEQTPITWQSVIKHMPRNVLAFAARFTQSIV